MGQATRSDRLEAELEAAEQSRDMFLNMAMAFAAMMLQRVPADVDTDKRKAARSIAEAFLDVSDEDDPMSIGYSITNLQVMNDNLEAEYKSGMLQ